MDDAYSLCIDSKLVESVHSLYINLVKEMVFIHTEPRFLSNLHITLERDNPDRKVTSPIRCGRAIIFQFVYRCGGRYLAWDYDHCLRYPLHHLPSYCPG